MVERIGIGFGVLDAHYLQFLLAAQEEAQLLAHTVAAHVNHHIGLLGQGPLALLLKQHFQHIRPSAVACCGDNLGQHEQLAVRANAVDGGGQFLVHLPHHQQRQAGFCNGPQILGDSLGLNTNRERADAANGGQLLRGEAEERLIDLHIHVNGQSLLRQPRQGLVEQARMVGFAIGCLVICHIEAGRVGLQGVHLRQGLPLPLPKAASGAVGRDDEQGQAAIIGFGNGRQQGQERGTRGDADGHGTLQGERNAKGYKSRAPLVGHGGQTEASLVEIVHYRRIARARTGHDLLHLVRLEQGSQATNYWFIGEHI